MTVEDIKAQYSMRDVVEQCGITVDRSHKAHCPFHTGDNTASLHVYADHFYCFACGASGDIFAFFMRMNDCDFNTAFEMLGGKRGKLTEAGYHRIAKRKAEKAKRQQALLKARTRFDHALEQLEIWQRILDMAKADPSTEFSAGFCLALKWVTRWDAEADEALENLLDVMEQDK